MPALEPQTYHRKSANLRMKRRSDLVPELKYMRFLQGRRIEEAVGDRKMILLEDKTCEVETDTMHQSAFL